MLWFLKVHNINFGMYD